MKTLKSTLIHNKKKMKDKTMNSLTNLITHSAKHQCHYTQSQVGEHLAESEKMNENDFLVRDHLFSTYEKSSEKLTFLSP